MCVSQSQDGEACSSDKFAVFRALGLNLKSGMDMHGRLWMTDEPAKLTTNGCFGGVCSYHVLPSSSQTLSSDNM